MTNRWKIAFFSLLAVVVIFGIVLIQMLFTNVNSDEEMEPPVKTGETVFTVHTTKERLNPFIQSKLDALTYDRENVDFTVVLEDKVHVNGYVNVFNHQLNFQMQLDPLVLDNGDLLLEQESFYIGQLPVPKKQVLSFFAKNARLPEWISIDADSEKIYILLSKINISDDIRIRANVVDLENDEIAFDLYMINDHVSE